MSYVIGGNTWLMVLVVLMVIMVLMVLMVLGEVLGVR
jgi:hypothetical protein